MLLDVTSEGNRGKARGGVGRLRVWFGGGGRNRTGVDGFAGRCMATLPPRRVVDRSRLVGRKKSKCQGRAGALPERNWSGKRVSNSRPQPWQGCALPTELFPRRTTLNYSRDTDWPLG